MPITTKHGTGPFGYLGTMHGTGPNYHSEQHMGPHDWILVVQSSGLPLVPINQKWDQYPFMGWDLMIAYFLQAL